MAGGGHLGTLGDEGTRGISSLNPFFCRTPNPHFCAIGVSQKSDFCTTGFPPKPHFCNTGSSQKHIFATLGPPQELGFFCRVGTPKKTHFAAQDPPINLFLHHEIPQKIHFCSAGSSKKPNFAPWGPPIILFLHHGDPQETFFFFFFSRGVPQNPHFSSIPPPKNPFSGPQKPHFCSAGSSKKCKFYTTGSPDKSIFALWDPPLAQSCRPKIMQKSTNFCSPETP